MEQGSKRLVPSDTPKFPTAAGTTIEGLDALAGEIREALAVYPYFYVLRDRPDLEQRPQIEDLLKRLSRPSVAPDGYNEKVSFTRVRIDREKAEQHAHVTHYSRTHLPIAPHTDSSNMPAPHELVVFQFLVPDPEGGENVLVPIDDLIEQLDESVQARLREAVYPFGNADYPILSADGDSQEIRYYRAQIDRSAGLAERSLGSGYRAAIDVLDRCLDADGNYPRVRLEAHDILFLNNRRVLHGRAGFAEDSPRLMHRFRLRADPFVAPTDRSASAVDVPATPSSAPATPAADTGARTKDPEVRELLRQGRALVREGRIDEALERQLAARRMAPDDPEVLEALGGLYLRTGEFAESTGVYRECCARDPDGYECHLALSSLLQRDGQHAEARELLKKAVRSHPVVPPRRIHPERPKLLRARGLAGSAYKILRHSDGHYSYLLRGGHFSVKDLLDKRAYNVAVLNIIDDNLDRVERIANVELIINTISCPDLERASLLALARYLDRRPETPVINHPRQVLETARERNYLRLNALPGVVLPRTERVQWDGVSTAKMVREVLGLGFEFPLIMRRAGSQTGTSVILVNDASALGDAFEKAMPGQDYYLIQYVDCRSKTPYFNKKRIFCIDGSYYPVANLHKESWNIHSGDRYNVMDKTPWMQDEEKAYLGDLVGHIGSENYNRLSAIRDVMGLDFFGIDFTIQADGSLFIFEINPAMRHNFDHVKSFPYTEPYLKKISNAFNTMVVKRLGGT